MLVVCSPPPSRRTGDPRTKEGSPPGVGGTGRPGNPWPVGQKNPLTMTLKMAAADSQSVVVAVVVAVDVDLKLYLLCGG